MRFSTRSLNLIAVCSVMLVAACQSGREASPANTADMQAESGTLRIEDVIRRQAPDVMIQRSGGRLRMQIRGLNTIAAGTDPLLVIDGVSFDTPDALLDLNPADVERVQVLKDAAASMYGVRGANGVVVVTTRRGR